MDILKVKLTIRAALQHLVKLEQALDIGDHQAAETAVYETRRELGLLRQILDQEPRPAECRALPELEVLDPSDIDHQLLADVRDAFDQVCLS